MNPEASGRRDYGLGTFCGSLSYAIAGILRNYASTFAASMIAAVVKNRDSGRDLSRFLAECQKGIKWGLGPGEIGFWNSHFGCRKAASDKKVPDRVGSGIRQRIIGA
jgi:hypothetical protein